MAHFVTGPSRFVVWLNETLANRELVGGKAASLSRLASLDAPVPPAFALTTHAYAQFAAENGFPSQAADIAVADLPHLRANILSAPLPDSISEALASGYKAFQTMLGEDLALAVRSSGTAEDSAAFSFAGLHDTVLDVRTLAGLEVGSQAMLGLTMVGPSGFLPPRWRTRTEISDIAVVVQQLVRCDVSFVVFTADPVRHANDRLVIGATWGLGETIVSGLVVPDHITIDGDGKILEYLVGDKHLMVIPGGSPGDGTREVPVPRALRTLAALTHDQALEIARVAREISRRLEFEADLEGGIAGGVIHLFQARPITTLNTSSIGN